MRKCTQIIRVGSGVFCALYDDGKIFLYHTSADYNNRKGWVEIPEPPADTPFDAPPDICGGCGQPFDSIACGPSHASEYCRRWPVGSPPL